MSYYDTAPAWHRWVDNGYDHLTRLGMLALVVMGVALFAVAAYLINRRGIIQK
jgi:esterase/lipase